jgi:hypothetical protein
MSASIESKYTIKKQKKELIMAAALPAIIGTFNYPYGNSVEANRRIQFSRTGAEANTIQAKIYLLKAAGERGACISTIAGNQIFVEVENVAQQARIVRLGGTPRDPVMLSNLPVAQQNAIMQSLANRYITVGSQLLSPKVESL